MSTTPSDILNPADALDQLAGEYVLGTLNAEQRREVQTRQALEPALREAVQRWEARLLPLTQLAPPEIPPAQLWARIEASLDAKAQAQASPYIATYAAIEAETAPTSPAASRPVHPARSAPRKPTLADWWSNLQLWRGLAGTGFAAAAIMAALLVNQLGAPLAPPRFMVVLVGPQDKAPGWVVQASSSSQVNLIPLAVTEVPADKALQLWTKADDWSGPVSLGLVKPGQSLQIALDKLPPLQPNQLFELTLEPPNGSPLSKPTGPIQFIGRAVKVI